LRGTNPCVLVYMPGPSVHVFDLPFPTDQKPRPRNDEHAYQSSWSFEFFVLKP
jgi:hypothetical protein